MSETDADKSTIAEARRRAERAERLQRGAAAILDEEHELIEPEELERMRRPRLR